MRPIDADAAREAVIERWKKRREEYGIYYDTGCEYGKNDDLEWLDSLPTIDAVPVVHGEWIDEYASEVYGWDVTLAGRDPVVGHKCSRCKESSYCNDCGDELLTNYCPNCGAKMDLR